MCERARVCAYTHREPCPVPYRGTGIRTEVLTPEPTYPYALSHLPSLQLGLFQEWWSELQQQVTLCVLISILRITPSFSSSGRAISPHKTRLDVTCRPWWSHRNPSVCLRWCLGKCQSDQYFLLYTCDLTLPGEVPSKFSSVFQADLKLSEDFKRQRHCLIPCPILMTHSRNI